MKNLTIEERELYLYATDHYKDVLDKISMTCVSPLICIRKVLKIAMDDYNHNYSTKDCNPFSNENFHNVARAIYEDKEDNNNAI